LAYIIFSSLTEFDISSNNIGSEVADDIAVVLSHNNKLQKLDIANNNLKTYGAIKIARTLKGVSILHLCWSLIFQAMMLEIKQLVKL